MQRIDLSKLSAPAIWGDDNQVGYGVGGHESSITSVVAGRDKMASRWCLSIRFHCCIATCGEFGCRLGLANAVSSIVQDGIGFEQGG